MSDIENIPPELLEAMNREGWSLKQKEEYLIEYLIMMDDIENLDPHQWQLLRSRLEKITADRKLH